MWQVVAWVGELIALFYMAFPILIRFSLKAKAHPRLEKLEASDIPDVLADYLYGQANALREDGFTPEAYLALNDSTPNVRTYLILMTNRAAGDKAIVTAHMIHAPENPPKMGVRYINFSTRFASGKVVDTSNLDQPTAFKTVPGNTKVRPGRIQDPHLLYQIHRHAIAQFAGIAPNDAKVVYPEGQALSYLTEVTARTYAEQTAFGLFYSDEEFGETIYHPTWYGAYYMAWRVMFPLSQIDRMLSARRANQVIQSFRETAPQSNRP